MKKAVGGIQFERLEDHELYTEAMRSLELAKATYAEKDFKLAIRTCEEIVCKKLRTEALRFVAEALVKANEINWSLELMERLDSPKKALIFAHICKQTGEIKYLAAAEKEVKEIAEKRSKDFIFREVLDIVSN